MSNKTQLVTNNALLEECVTRVNAAREVAASLPEAGSGGGSVETCTVTISSPGTITRYMVYRYIDGNTVSEYIEAISESSVTLENVIKGSPITCMSHSFGSISVTNATVKFNYNDDFAGVNIAFLVADS